MVSLPPASFHLNFQVTTIIPGSPSPGTGFFQVPLKTPSDIHMNLSLRIISIWMQGYKGNSQILVLHCWNCKDFAAESASNYTSRDFYENLLRHLMTKANHYCYFSQISTRLYLLLSSLQHDKLYWSDMAQKYTFSCIEWIRKSCIFNYL